MDSEKLVEDIAQARRGDREALDRVLTAMQSRLRAAAAHQLRAPLRQKMATSDLLQSTYVDVVRSIREFEGGDADTLAAWIARIMENNLRDRLRFFGRQRRQGEQLEEQPSELAGPTETPSIAAMQIENLSLVGKALAELPEDHRQIIQLRAIDGLEYEEIATRLGKSQGALRMLMSRARTSLALKLDRMLDGGS